MITEEQRRILQESLKRLGYARNHQIRLYGASYDLTSDPIVMADRLVVVDAIERKSGQSRRIRIPLTILNLVKQNSAA